MNSHNGPGLLQQRYLPEENQNDDDDDDDDDDDMTLTRVYSSAN